MGDMWFIFIFKLFINKNNTMKLVFQYRAYTCTNTDQSVGGWFRECSRMQRRWLFGLCWPTYHHLVKINACTILQVRYFFARRHVGLAFLLPSSARKSTSNLCPHELSRLQGEEEDSRRSRRGKGSLPSRDDRVYGHHLPVHQTRRQGC